MEAIRYDLVSLEDYLAAEGRSEVRHEYLAGMVYAMAGASRNHNRITLNISRRLLEKLESGPCIPYMTDLRLRIASQAGVSIYYPDVMVVCGEAAGDEMHIENPTVIFEVLSESTERIDRREKYLAYQMIPSLKQYVLVAQDGVRVESFSMGSGGPGEVLKSITGALVLPSLACELSLAEIYAGVEGLAV
jgi:Uma2 family endonuclease